jgi:hypothetical protein
MPRRAGAVEERFAKLKEELKAEQAARAFADGALQAARREPGSGRHDAEGAGAVAPERSANPGR